MYKIKLELIRLNDTNRLYKIANPILGLTGGVATGKSTVTYKLIQMGFPVIEADRLVHQIYTKKSSFEFIKENFPSAITGEKIIFPTLRKIFFENSNAQDLIETFIYAQLEKAFQKKAEDFGQHDFLIYDVPLLFEKELNKLTDSSVCVYCDQATQLSRLIKRDDIEKDLGLKIIEAQIDIERKKELSDWVIENSGTMDDLNPELNKFLDHYFTT